MLEGLENEAQEGRKGCAPTRNRCRCGSGVRIVSVRSKEMFMRFEKFSISSSLPGLLDRLRKCCAKVHCRFLAVYFVSEF